MHPEDPLRAPAQAAGHGDQDAFATLVRATQAEVWRFLAALADRSHADDLTQETYLRAYQALPGFRGEASVRTWLLAIARRVAADHLRRLARRPRSARPPVAEDWVAADQSGRSDLARLIAALDTDRREAFALTQLLGLSYAEAASVCDVPVGTIRSRVARARADLIRGLDTPAVAPDESGRGPGAVRARRG
jgi:RNA polymerase sigma-70 factor (ECF subfamily)